MERKAAMLDELVTAAVMAQREMPAVLNRNGTLRRPSSPGFVAAHRRLALAWQDARILCGFSTVVP